VSLLSTVLPFQSYFYNEDVFNFNYGQAKAASGNYKEAEEVSVWNSDQFLLQILLGYLKPRAQPGGGGVRGLKPPPLSQVKVKKNDKNF